MGPKGVMESFWGNFSIWKGTHPPLWVCEGRIGFDYQAQAASNRFRSISIKGYQSREPLRVPRASVCLSLSASKRVNVPLGSREGGVGLLLLFLSCPHLSLFTHKSNGGRGTQWKLSLSQALALCLVFSLGACF